MCIMRSFMIVFLSRYFYGDQMKEDKMVWACGTQRGEEKCKIHTGIWWQKPDRDHIQDLCRDWSIILKQSQKKQDGDGITQDRDKLQAAVKMVIELGGSIKYMKFVEQLRNYQLLKKDSVLCSWLVGWLVELFSLVRQVGDSVTFQTGNRNKTDREDIL